MATRDDAEQELWARLHAAEQRAEQAERERDEARAKVEMAVEFEIAPDVFVRRMLQRDGAALWRVSRNSGVLTKQGDWEYEPIPSSRDDSWLARARFATFNEAVAAARAALEDK